MSRERRNDIRLPGQAGNIEKAGENRVCGEGKKHIQVDRAGKEVS